MDSYALNSSRDPAKSAAFSSSGSEEDDSKQKPEIDSCWFIRLSGGARPLVRARYACGSMVATGGPWRLDRGFWGFCGCT